MRGNIVLLDGAAGTSLWEKAEERGIEKKPVWTYNVTHPEMVRELAGEFLSAGAQVIHANTFGANGPAVRRSTAFDPAEVVRTGVRLAREAVGDRAKISLAVGPLMTLLEPYGDMEEEECRDIYEEQIGAGMSEHPDAITLMTFMDLEMMRIAATVAKGYGVPVYCAMTFEKHGRTMMGNTVQQIVDTLTPLNIDAIGMNCSLGPDLALPVIRAFSECTALPLIFKPNAGMPIVASGGEVTTDYDIPTFIRQVMPALEYVTYIGGCCGCNAGYIRALGEAMG